MYVLYENAHDRKWLSEKTVCENNLKGDDSDPN